MDVTALSGPARVRLLDSGERAAWADALAGVPHSYWHTWPAARAVAITSGRAAHLFCVDGGTARTRAACVVAEREYGGEVDVYSPSFAAMVAEDGAAARSAWLDLVRDRGFVCGYFALHPVLGAREAYEDPEQRGELMVLDLRRGATSLLRAADRSVRRAIRDWHAAGRRYVTDRGELARFVQREYLPFMQRVGALARTLWTPEALQLMLDDPALLMVGAEDDDGLCAFYSFGSTPFGAEAHLNVSVRGGREATTALLWWGIEQLAARGVPWLHLGGGVHTGDAIERAKLKFRPSRHPLLAAAEVYDAERYARLCSLAGADSVPATFFPPFHGGPAGSESP